MAIPKRHNIFQVLKDYLQRLVADDSPTTGQMLVSIPISVPDAATGDIDIVMNDKFEVVDVTCIKRAGAGAANTMQIKNGANAISNAIACDTDNAVTRAGTIDDAQSVIAAGGTLRLTATRAAGTRTCQVFVHGYHRA